MVPQLAVRVAGAEVGCENPRPPIGASVGATVSAGEGLGAMVGVGDA